MMMRSTSTQPDQQRPTPAHWTRMLLALGLPCGLFLSACRGNKSEDPPIHLQQNMDFQRFEAQEENPFFEDGRAMRPPVLNTIARGELDEDSHTSTGRVDGAHAATLPMPLTATLLERGRQRYDIYCAVCHGRTGDGKSVIRQRNAMRVAPPSYLEQRLLAQPVGYFFEIISKGVRTMPPYAAQIPGADRWAIAAYVRALQLAGSGSCKHVPEAVRTSQGWTCEPTNDSEE